MRGPSRQITSRLVAGAFALAATARGEIGNDQPLGAVRDAGERQRGGRERAVRRETWPAPSPSSRPVEVAQPAEQRRVVVGGDVRRADDPRQQIRFGTSISCSNSATSASVSVPMWRVREAPGDEVDLAHAAMPCAEQQPPPPLVQPALDRWSRSYPLAQHEKPGLAGQG